MSSLVPSILSPLSLLALAAWVYLLVGHGRFWLADQRLPDRATNPGGVGRAVVAIVPARDEAEVIGQALASLLDQPDLRIVLVDDHSGDATPAIAAALAAGHPGRMLIVSPPLLPAGWTGKLWALEAGTRAAVDFAPDADWFLLTDADIGHAPGAVARLHAFAEERRLDLASLMVRLDDSGVWGRLLMPAFVFFFQKLYPFPRVNNPKSRVAGAAGGCVLIRRSALERAGGVAAIRAALIDDCWLAGAVKRTGGRIWLGLSAQSISLRTNGGLAGIWTMVARTAYTQLRYSPLLLAGTVIGMTILYLVPPLAAVVGSLRTDDPVLLVAGFATWLLMSVAFIPTLRLYGQSGLRAPLLPVAAALYSLMTLSSAWRHARGRGGQWKGRVYPAKGG